VCGAALGRAHCDLTQAPRYLAAARPRLRRCTPRPLGGVVVAWLRMALRGGAALRAQAWCAVQRCGGRTAV